MTWRWAMATASAVFALAGCTNLNEFKIDQRNHALARRAWNCVKDVYRDIEFPSDFAAGFKQAYVDVASGGNGCPPVLPPRSYWTVDYASPEGHRRTQTWFEGYKYGATVAEQDGIGVWITLPTGHPQPGPPIDLTPILDLEKQEEKKASEKPKPAPVEPPKPEKSGPKVEKPSPEERPSPPAKPAEPPAKQTPAPEVKKAAPPKDVKKAAPPAVEQKPEKPETAKKASKPASKKKSSLPGVPKEMPVEIPDDRR